MKLRLLAILSVYLICSATPSFSQSDSLHRLWDHNLIASINLAQSSFSHWSAGGANALSYLASLNGKSIRDTDVTNWATSYKFAYGQTRVADLGLRKTEDEINVESVLTYKLGVHINPYVSAGFLTQFAPGYNYSDTGREETSMFFDPAYFKQAVGVGFNYNKYFQTRLGAALREIVTSVYTSFADDPKTPEVERNRIEGGLESVSEIEVPVDDNVLFRGKLDLFSPIKTMDRIVLHGSSTIAAKISKYFTTELTAAFVNEPDVSPFTQVKQGLSLGITYSLF